MATNTRSAGGRGTNGKGTGKKKSSSTAKIIIFVIEILVIVAMLLVVWKVWDTTSSEGANIHEGYEDPDDAGINPSIQQATNNKDNTTGNEGGSDETVAPPLKIAEYWNIALFGLDATKPNQLYKNSRSDSIMIASIHKETGEIKLVSVYRDTFLNVGNDRYTKCNAAYSNGGADQAISMLNMNMDLNITDFVAVGYPALIGCIDALGGVWVDIDKEELKHINNYQTSIVRDVTSLANYEIVKVTETGTQLLNGLQASAYCRIRQTNGNDFKRAERQREVIKAMTEKAQSADLDTLLEVVKVVAPNVYSTFDLSDTAKMTELLKNIGKYKIVDEGGFPTEELRTTGNIGAEGSCVIPLSLEANVVELHRFLFGEENYEVSDEVKECSKNVAAKTAPYLN